MAAQAHLQQGDILLSINEFALSDNHPQVKAAIAQTANTSPLRIRINRNGAELEITTVSGSQPSSTPSIPPPATATPVLPPNDYL